MSSAGAAPAPSCVEVLPADVAGGPSALNALKAWQHSSDIELPEMMCGAPAESGSCLPGGPGGLSCAGQQDAGMYWMAADKQKDEQMMMQGQVVQFLLPQGFPQGAIQLGQGHGQGQGQQLYVPVVAARLPAAAWGGTNVGSETMGMWVPMQSLQQTQLPPFPSGGESHHHLQPQMMQQQQACQQQQTCQSPQRCQQGACQQQSSQQEACHRHQLCLQPQTGQQQPSCQMQPTCQQGPCQQQQSCQQQPSCQMQPTCQQGPCQQQQSCQQQQQSSQQQFDQQQVIDRQQRLLLDLQAKLAAQQQLQVILQQRLQEQAKMQQKQQVRDKRQSQQPADVRSQEYLQEFELRQQQFLAGEHYAQRSASQQTELKQAKPQIHSQPTALRPQQQQLHAPPSAQRQLPDDCRAQQQMQQAAAVLQEAHSPMGSSSRAQLFIMSSPTNQMMGQQDARAVSWGWHGDAGALPYYACPPSDLYFPSLTEAQMQQHTLAYSQSDLKQQQRQQSAKLGNCQGSCDQHMGTSTTPGNAAGPQRRGAAEFRHGSMEAPNHGPSSPAGFSVPFANNALAEQCATAAPTSLAVVDTMKAQLQALQAEDPAAVFITRRINKLGFASPEALRLHFSRYGEVKSVYVAHSRVKTVLRAHRSEAAGAHWRLRAAALGFVVMSSASDTAQILQEGPEHVVSGVQIRVHPFYQKQSSKVLMAGCMSPANNDVVEMPVPIMGGQHIFGWDGFPARYSNYQDDDQRSLYED